ncbi:MAG TPA: M28 family peptidase [Spirochaetes bacterium]|nr:M28 family peptidase [Spirochaetota bacterium]
MKSLGSIWLGIGIWFALQLAFLLASPLSIIFKLAALPAVLVGGKGFIAGSLLFLCGGLVLYRMGAAGKGRRVAPGGAARKAALVPLFAVKASSIADGVMVDDAKVPAQAEIFSWITDVYNMGERRTGSAADLKAVDYLERKLKEFGIADVRTEPFVFDYWEAEDWGLTVTGRGVPDERPATFYVPYSRPTGREGVTADLVYVGKGTKADFKRADVRGKIVLADLPAVDISWDKMKIFSYLAHDPDGTTKNWAHPYPIGWMFKYEAVYEKAKEHGAAGVVGILRGYPDIGTFTYYAPYDGIFRTLPSLYVMEKDGERIRAMLGKGPVSAKLVLAAKTAKRGGKTATVYGTLPGKSDTALIIHCHHDAPWRSGIEDSSGVGMVLALAKYYARVPLEKRERTLVFMLTGSHMVGSRSNYDFIEKHRDGLMKKVIYDICIEHIADDYNPPAPSTGNPEPRGVFITENPVMLATYARLVRRHNLPRLLVFPTGSPLGVPTDAQPFHKSGYAVNTMISGPSWLFDDDDTLERVDEKQLVPVARLYIDLISQTGRKDDWMLLFNLNWAVIGLILLVLSPLSIIALGKKER